MTSFWRPKYAKMTRFWPFSPKMTDFHQIGPINYMFDQIYVHKADWNIFLETFREKLFYHFPQILTYDVILATKMTQFWPFSPKMSYFDQIDPINDTLTKFMSINLTEIIFKKFKRKNYLTTFPKFWPVAPFWPKMTQFWTIFTQNDLFWPNWPH